ncbi:MAG: tetratricopeptide repeat protein [Caldimicrobium sp.]|nr:tetratricopeptide repeat protein [Caldimicrobium sp.]MCX7872815.1 tetratricopeptide repeat protein [Caldimicrobium sp.]MDW8093606.1 tetratricopeptide repeat protein [Caldimicrobium sp.]
MPLFIPKLFLIKSKNKIPNLLLFFIISIIFLLKTPYKAHSLNLEEAYYYFLLSQIVANFPEEVEFYLQKAIEKDKGSIFLKKSLLTLYLQQRNLSSAENLAKELLQKAPYDREINLMAVRIFLHQKRPKDAISIIENFLKKNPKDEHFLSILISIYLQEKEWDQALTKLEDLERIYPNNYVFHLYKARIFREKGDISSAKKAYLQTLALIPDNKNLIVEVLRFLESIKDYEEIEKILINYLAQNPEDRDFLRLLFGLYFEQKEYEKSEKLLREYLKKQKDQPELLFYLGLTLEYRNRLKEAQSIYLEVPQDSPWYLEAQRRLFEIYKREDLNSAKKLLETIRLTKMREKSYFLFLAHSYEKIDLCEEGIEIAIEGLKLFPEDVDLILALAINYACIEDYQRVLEIVEPLLNKYPEDAYILNFVGYSLVELNKDLDRAETLLIKANQLKPQDPYIEDSLGWLYFKKNDLQKAKFYLEKAITNLKGEEEPIILDHLGDVYFKLGNYPLACDLYKKAFEKTLHKRERKKIQEKLRHCPRE